MIDTVPAEHWVHAEVRYVNELRSYRADGPGGSLAGEVLLAVPKELERVTLIGGFVGAYGATGGGESSGWADGPGPDESATTHWAVGPEVQALLHFAQRRADLRVATGVRYRSFAAPRFRAWAVEIPIDIGIDVALARDTAWIGAFLRTSFMNTPHDTTGQHWNPGPEAAFGAALGLRFAVSL